MSEEIEISREMKERLKKHCELYGKSFDSALHEAIAGFVCERQNCRVTTEEPLKNQDADQ